MGRSALTAPCGVVELRSFSRTPGQGLLDGCGRRLANNARGTQTLHPLHIVDDAQGSRLLAMLGVCTTTFLALCCLRSAFAHQATFSTSPAGHLQDLGESYEFSHPIRRAAVIGAGANGLLHAAALLEAGLEVRMFERAPRPGGTWNYNEKKPVPASFPCVLSSEAGRLFQKDLNILNSLMYDIGIGRSRFQHIFRTYQNDYRSPTFILMGMRDLVMI